MNELIRQAIDNLNSTKVTLSGTPNNLFSSSVPDGVTRYIYCLIFEGTATDDTAYIGDIPVRVSAYTTEPFPKNPDILTPIIKVRSGQNVQGYTSAGENIVVTILYWDRRD